MTELHTLAVARDVDPPNQGHSSSHAQQEPLIVAAYSILRREFRRLHALQSRIASPPTPDEVHQLRVHARRLRVGLRLFRPMLPSREAERLRADLRWLARALGEVRDLDVYVATFRAYAPRAGTAEHRDVAAYELYLRRERTQTRSKLTRLLTTHRYAQLFTRAGTFGAPAPEALHRWKALSVRDGARKSLAKSVGRVRSLGNRITASSRPAEYHALRIRAKRLRYELEFLGQVCVDLKPAAKATKALQDLLGEHQDAYTASARLRRYARGLRAQAEGVLRLPPALDDLRRSQLQQARDIRQTFPAHWQRYLPVVTAALRALD